MKYLDLLTKIPLPRLILFVLTMIVFFFAMEHMTWGQKIVEYLIGMEAAR